MAGRSGHHSRFVVVRERIALVGVGQTIPRQWSVRTPFRVRSEGPRERGRDEGGDFLARLIVGLSAESGFYAACRDAIKMGLSSERRTSYFQRVNLTRCNACPDLG
jgi:hypothetical protein